MRKPSVKSAERAAKAWNQKYPVGTAVRVTNDFGDILETKTRSVAWALPSGTAVVMVEGISGGYMLERVKAA